MAEHKEWAVSIVATSEHSYNILARTPEEAISLAEGLFEDGDLGIVSGSEIETADAASGDGTESFVIEDGFELEEETIEP